MLNLQPALLNMHAFKYLPLKKKSSLNQWVGTSTTSQLTIKNSGAAGNMRVSSMIATACTVPTALFLGRESGGIGRRARLRIWWVTVGVQIPPLAPINAQDRG